MFTPHDSPVLSALGCQKQNNRQVLLRASRPLISLDFKLTSVPLGNEGWLWRLPTCEIILKDATPATHTYRPASASSLNYPDRPSVYVSGAPHSALHHSFPRRGRMANRHAEVYLNQTLEFTLPRRYLNRACHLFHSISEANSSVSLEGMYTVAENRRPRRMSKGGGLHPAIHLQDFL